MGFEFLFFWLALVLCLELFLVKTAAYLLSILLVLALLLIVFLFWTEFDMLASLIFGVYSSVFIVFFLLLLHFATFWAPANKQKSSHKSSAVYAFSLTFLLFISFSFVTCLPSQHNGLSGFFLFNYLWQDFFVCVNTVTSMTVQLLHHFFFRFFVFETVLLNFYLFFSLVLALGLLYLFRLYSNLKPHARVWSLGAGIRHDKTVAYAPHTPNVRVRLINKFRRQTRRQNSSVIRYR